MLSSFKRLSSALSISVLSQAVWSVNNFATVFILAALLDIGSFGWFTFGLSVRQLGQSIVGGLVLSPLTVLSHRDSADSIPGSTLRMTIVGSFYWFCLATLVLSIAACFYIGSASMAFAVFLIGGIAIDIQRRFLYLDERQISDLVGAIYNLVMTLMCIVVMYSLRALEFDTTYLCIGCVAMSWVFISNHKVWITSIRKIDFTALLRLWRIGRWGLASNIAGYIYSRVNTYYTLLLIGPAGVAVLELGRQMVSVAQVYLLGMANYWQPRLAKMAKSVPLQDYNKRLLKITLIQSIAGAGLLVFALAMFWWIVPRVFPSGGAEYQDSFGVALVFSGAMLCQLLYQHISFSIYAFDKAYMSFLARAVASIITLAIVFPVIDQFGLMGAAWTWTLGEIIVLMSTFLAFFWVVRERASLQASLG